MAYDPRPVAQRSKQTSEIARDLRAFADAGVAAGYAEKLLAVAAELEAMAAASQAMAAA